MRHRQLLLGALAALAGALAVTGGPASGAARPAGAIDMTFVERPATFRFIDVAPRGSARVSAGDRSIMTSALSLPEGHRRAGMSALECTALRAGRPRSVLFHCTGGLRLRDGTLSVDGLISGADASVSLTVVGGSGAYSGRHGSIISRPRPRGRLLDDTLHLEPAGRGS